MLGTGKRTEVTMEYYEVSPVSQRIAWLNGQHMKMTAGLTALSWALGCLYDSRHPQVVWQPGCSVKLDRPKVNRIKGHTSHIHPVACPAAVTTAVQTGTYLTFYLENFNTVDQCVLELEGLWRVHKEPEDDLDHRNKIWVIRMDTTDTHDLQCHQPKAQDIFNDLGLLASDFFTTRRSSKTQRLSPTKNRSRSGQHKKSPSYKINSSRRRSHKRSLTPVTASRIMHQAFTQCQQNLQDAEVGGVADCHAERSSSIRMAAAGASLSYISSVTEGEESWSNEEDERKIERTNSTDIENEISDADDENWSEAAEENWSEFGRNSWSDVNENKVDKPGKGFQNHEDGNCFQELNHSDNMYGNQGFIRADSENSPFIYEDRNQYAKAINVNRDNVSLQLKNCDTIKRTKELNNGTDSRLRQRLGRISTSTPVPQDSPQKDFSQSRQISRNGDTYNDIDAGRSIANSIRKVHESLGDNNRQSLTSVSQSSMAYNPIHFGRSPSPGKLHEKKIETEDAQYEKKTGPEDSRYEKRSGPEDTITRSKGAAEPTFTDMEEHHKRMLVDLSKHEVVGTWLYSSDEEDDYDDDEGIYKKEEAFFRVDVTELLHELAHVQQRRHSPKLTIPNNTSASREEGSAELQGSTGSSVEETRTAFATHINDECNGPSKLEQKPEKCGHFEGEILREVQPKIANIFDARLQDTATGHELEKERMKERSPHNFQSKNWSAMVKDVLLRTTRNVSSGEKNASVWKWSHENLNNTVHQSEAQSTHLRSVYSRTQRTEADENKENSMTPAHQVTENKFNLRNMVKQFEAMSFNAQKTEKKISGTSNYGRGSLFSQRTDDVGRENLQEARLQLERSATNSETRPKEPRISPSPNPFSVKTATLETGLTEFSSSDNLKNNQEKTCQHSSLDSEFRSSSSSLTQSTILIQTNKLPLNTETNSKNERNERYDIDQHNSPQFSLSRNDFSPCSKNMNTTKFLAKQLHSSERQHTISHCNGKGPSSSRATATEFETILPPGPDGDFLDDFTRKPRSESLSLTCETKHDPPQRSASVTPSSHSQSLSSLLEPDRQDTTNSKQHNSNSIASSEETLERLDRTGRRSPKSKPSVFTVKKQLSRSREVRTLPGYQQNSIKMNYDSKPTPGPEQQAEHVHGSSHSSPGQAYYEMGPTPGTDTHKLQHRPEESFTSRDNEVISKYEEVSPNNRKTEGVLFSKPWTERHLESTNNEFHGEKSRAAEMAEKSVPESALVVFRLQPSAPHQAWQFKKAILKVHHRDHTRKREDKTTLRRNAHLLRKRR